MHSKGVSSFKTRTRKGGSFQRNKLHWFSSLLLLLLLRIVEYSLDINKIVVPLIGIKQYRGSISVVVPRYNINRVSGSFIKSSWYISVKTFYNKCLKYFLRTGILPATFFLSKIILHTGNYKIINPSSSTKQNARICGILFPKGLNTFDRIFQETPEIRFSVEFLNSRRSSNIAKALWYPYTRETKGNSVPLSSERRV